MAKKTKIKPPEQEPRYRWSHPSEWLESRIMNLGALNPADNPIGELESLARALAGQLDGDQIQDLFQSEMDADGYFQNLDACTDCGSTAGPTIPPGSADAHCAACGADWNSEDHQ